MSGVDGMGFGIRWIAELVVWKISPSLQQIGQPIIHSPSLSIPTIPTFPSPSSLSPLAGYNSATPMYNNINVQCGRLEEVPLPRDKDRNAGVPLPPGAQRQIAGQVAQAPSDLLHHQ